LFEIAFTVAAVGDAAIKPANETAKKAANIKLALFLIQSCISIALNTRPSQRSPMQHTHHHANQPPIFYFRFPRNNLLWVLQASNANTHQRISP
ncbi:hypothetical protein HY994_00920, partial [Candidatus Micrarchaeota archaeon]|nr:hypothetical protein [Candidatus Micrarchaeota archaeon]